MLHTYMQDHHAGAAAGIELFRRVAEDHEDPHVRQVVSRIGDETAEDLADLEELMTLAGTSPSLLKDLPAKAAEKVGQLKPNRRFAERSPLSDLLELEALTLAVTGKKLGFKALLDIGDPPSAPPDSGEARRAQHAGEEVSHSGLVEVERARIYSLPEAPPPLLGPALSPETAERAAAWADGLITVNSDLDSVAEIVGAYRGAGGRGPLALQVHISVAETLDHAWEMARDQWQNHALDPPLAADLATPEEFDIAGRYIPDEKIAEAVIVTDSVDELVGRLREFEQLGFEQIYLHHVAQDQAPFLELAEQKLLLRLHGAR